MKKLTALLLSLALALSLCACGGGSPDGDVSGNPSGEDVGESQPSGDVSRNRPGGAPEASTPLPVIGLTYNSERHFDEDLNGTVNSMQTALPGVNAETRENYPELAAALDRFREDALNAARENYQQREERLPDFIELGGNGGDDTMYGNVSSIIRRADAKAVSAVNAVQEYDGEPTAVIITKPPHLTPPPERKSRWKACSPTRARKCSTPVSRRNSIPCIPI